MQSQTTEPIIVLDNVSVVYGNSRVAALENASLTVNRGDFIAVTGPNGGGKTTMLKVVLQLVKPTRGEVAFFHNGSRVKRLDVGYLPQKNMIDNRFPVTVEEVVAMGLPGAVRPLHRIGDEEKRLIDSTLDAVGMADKRNNPIGTLSGGQLQRTLLGRAMISRPGVLVLDEPLSYIDKAFERHLYGIIEQLARQSTIILVSHEMSVIAEMANRHIIVDKTLHECHAAHHYTQSECE